VVIRTTYQDLDGKKHLTATKCNLPQNFPDNDYFSDINIQKGIVLTRYVEETKRILIDAQQISKFQYKEEKNDFLKAIDEIKLGNIEFAVFKFGYPLVPKLLYSHDDDSKLYENWEKEVFPKLLSTLSRTEILVIGIGFKYRDDKTKNNENKLVIGSICGENARVKDKMTFASSSRIMRNQLGLTMHQWEEKEFTYSKLLEQAIFCTHNFHPPPKVKTTIPIKEKTEDRDTFIKWLREACEKNVELTNLPEQFDLLLKKYHQLKTGI